MTPEEIETLRERYDIYDLKEVFDAALRLDAIENAGDEEVDAACGGLLKAYRSLSDSLFHKSMNDLENIAKGAIVERDKLRERIKEAEERIKDLEGDIEVAKYGL